MGRTLIFTRFWWAFLGIGALAVALAVGLPALTTSGADHLDGPSVGLGSGILDLGLTTPQGESSSLDITDVYAFQSPENEDNTVLIMAVNPAAGFLSPTTFDPEADYEFLIDTDGDAEEDLTIEIEFSEPDGDGVQELEVSGPGDIEGEGETGEDIELKNGGTLRADLFDDPFFFDLLAFLGAGAPARSFCDGGEFDFFAGLNVTAIVLEVPSSSLGPDDIGVWARTVIDGDQIDRMGRPGINTILIPSGSKNAFNEGEPEDDASFITVLGPTLGGLGLAPDILTIDTSSTDGFGPPGAPFLNGRQLEDDVIDVALDLLGLSPGSGFSDCVDENDEEFDNDFPYLAEANEAEEEED